MTKITNILTNNKPISVVEDIKPVKIYDKALLKNLGFDGVDSWLSSELRCGILKQISLTLTGCKAIFGTSSIRAAPSPIQTCNSTFLF